MPRDGIMPAAFTGLDLDRTHTLLVRYRLTSPIHIPEGIRRVIKTRPSHHSETPLRKPGLRIADNVPNTSLQYLFHGLRVSGFGILNVYHWEQLGQRGNVQYVVNFTLGRIQEGFQEWLVDMGAFVHDVVWHCHIWQNESGINVIEFTGRQLGVAAQHDIHVDGRHVRICPVPVV